MKLYIGNATRQVQEFSYRLPESAGVRKQEIPIGGQTQITGDMSMKDVDAILSQHEIYGLIDVMHIDRTRPFVGLCYSIDAELKPDAIEKLMRHNTGVLVERGKSLRVAAAVVEENRINSDLVESGRPPLRNFELSVVEENPSGNEEVAPVAEGYRINRSGGLAA